MSNLFDVLLKQAQKSPLTNDEQQALRSAVSRKRFYSIAGGIAGAGIGYYLSRLNKSMAMRMLMVAFNGTFLYGLGSSYATFMNLQRISDPEKYPHIAAAMKDIRNEIIRSRGVDPEHPERGRTSTIQKVPDFNHLPPSMTPEEKAEENANDGFFYTRFDSKDMDTSSDKQDAFGKSDPAPRTQTQSSTAYPAWDRIRNANPQSENAWDRVRKQGGQQQQHRDNDPSRLARDTENAWNTMYDNNNGSGDSISNDSSSAWGQISSSDDFPRSREDFDQSSSSNSAPGERFPRSREDFEGTSRSRTTKYGDSVYSS